MKHILSILLLILMIGCKSKIVETPEDAIQKTSDNVEESPTKIGVDFVTSEELQESVGYLASDELQGRETGSAGIEKAAVYIENKLKSYGVYPYYETYRDNYKAKGKDAFNIIGFIEGNDPELKEEIIILGAHYDHIGFGKKVGNDSIANGANDNASGTSAVLAMARYFAMKKSNKRSIMFALYSGEEMGLLGSKHLAEKFKSENINLYTMVNFEMIGVPFKDRDYVAFVTGYDMSNMSSKLNEYAGSKLIGFSQVAKQYNLFKASDNYAFYQEFNLPCQTVSSCDLTNFDFYHKVGDEADKMDYVHMANLVNKLLPAIEKVSTTPTKEIKMNE